MNQSVMHRSPITASTGIVNEETLMAYWKFTSRISCKEIENLQEEQSEIQSKIIFCGSDVRSISFFFAKREPIDLGSSEGRLNTFNVDRVYGWECSLKDALLIAAYLKDDRYKIEIVANTLRKTILF